MHEQCQGQEMIVTQQYQKQLAAKISFLSNNTQQNVHVAYTVASKKSKMGLSQNARYLWVDFVKGSVCYANIRKIDIFGKGSIPTPKSEIGLRQGRGRFDILQQQLKKGKFFIRIWDDDQSGKVRQQWVFSFTSLFVMDGFINAMSKGTSKPAQIKNPPKLEQKPNLITKKQEDDSLTKNGGQKGESQSKMKQKINQVPSFQGTKVIKSQQNSQSHFLLEKEDKTSHQNKQINNSNNFQSEKNSKIPQSYKKSNKKSIQENQKGKKKHFQSEKNSNIPQSYKKSNKNSDYNKQKYRSMQDDDSQQYDDSFLNVNKALNSIAYPVSGKKNKSWYLRGHRNEESQKIQLNLQAQCSQPIDSSGNKSEFSSNVGGLKWKEWTEKKQFSNINSNISYLENSKQTQSLQNDGIERHFLNSAYLSSEPKMQSIHTPSKSFNKKNKQFSKIQSTPEIPYHNWNRYFHESNYSLEVYAQFYANCKHYIYNNLLLSLLINKRGGSHCQAYFTDFVDGVQYWVYFPHTCRADSEYLRKIITFRDVRLENEGQMDKLSVQEGIKVYEDILEMRDQSQNVVNKYNQLMDCIIKNNINHKSNILIPTLSCYFEYLGYSIQCLASAPSHHINPTSQVQSIRAKYPQISQIIDMKNLSFYTLNQQQYQQPSPHFCYYRFINYAPPKHVSIDKKIIKELSEHINNGMPYKLGEIDNIMQFISGPQSYNQLIQNLNMRRKDLKVLNEMIENPYFSKIMAADMASSIFSCLLAYSLSLFISEQIDVVYEQDLPEEEYPHIAESFLEIIEQKHIEWLNLLISNEPPASNLMWDFICIIMQSSYGADCSNRSSVLLPMYLLSFTLVNTGAKLLPNPPYTSPYHPNIQLSQIFIKPQLLNKLLNIHYPSQSGIIDKEQIDKNITIQIVDFPPTIWQYHNIHHPLSVIHHMITPYLCRNSLIHPYLLKNLQKTGTQKQQLQKFIKFYGQKKEQIKFLYPFLAHCCEIYLLKHISMDSHPSIYKNILQQTELYTNPAIIYKKSEIKSHQHHILLKLKVYMQKSLQSSPESYEDINKIFNNILQDSELWTGQFNPYMAQFHQIILSHLISDKNSKSSYEYAVRVAKANLLLFMNNYPNRQILADAHSYLAIHIYGLHGNKFTQALKQLEISANIYTNALQYAQNTNNQPQMVRILNKKGKVNNQLALYRLQNRKQMDSKLSYYQIAAPLFQIMDRQLENSFSHGKKQKSIAMSIQVYLETLQTVIRVYNLSVSKSQKHQLNPSYNIFSVIRKYLLQAHLITTTSALSNLNSLKIMLRILFADYLFQTGGIGMEIYEYQEKIVLYEYLYVLITQQEGKITEIQAYKYLQEWENLQRKKYNGGKDHIQDDKKRHNGYEYLFPILEGQKIEHKCGYIYSKIVSVFRNIINHQKSPNLSSNQKCFKDEYRQNIYWLSIVVKLVGEGFILGIVSQTLNCQLSESPSKQSANERKIRKIVYYGQRIPPKTLYNEQEYGKSKYRTNHYYEQEENTESLVRY